METGTRQHSFLHAVILLFALFGLSIPAAAYDFVVNGIYYNIDGTNATVTYKSSSYNSYSGKVNIPSTVTYNGTTYFVTSIGNNAFYNCTGMTSVSIPNSVTTIGNYAFSYCTGMTSVSIPNSVTTIGNFAFSECKSITSISIPNSVTIIGNYAFYNCTSLSNLTLGNSVTTIETCAFCNCLSLESIFIPKSVASLDYTTFAGCSAVNSIVVEDGNMVFDSRNGCNAIIEKKGKTFPFLPTLLFGCKNSIIPNSVESIAGNAFRGITDLKVVNIPGSIKNIDHYAFEGCTGIVKVNITSIESWCDISFQNEYSNPLYYGHHLFLNGSEITELIIPNHKNYIPSYGFINCIGLKSVSIPNTVIEIGDCSFSGCSGLTSITIPESLEQIHYKAFLGCEGLKTVICKAVIPPRLDSFQNTFTQFSDVTYNNATLYVNGCLETYKNTPGWSLFRKIVNLVDIDITDDIRVSPTSFFINIDFDAEDQHVIRSFFTYDNTELNINEYNLCLTGLEPENNYVVYYSVEASQGLKTIKKSINTPSLLMNTKAAVMVTNKDARLMAETNMADEETSCGFEWRRYDAPEEMPSAKVYCPVYGGVMAGTLKNLSENVYYKYRPFYKSSAGNEYYGDWIAFITADAGVEFEPVVYTYDAPAVTQTDATLQGVALRGSEEITSQGFEYWQASKNNTLTASNNVTRVTAKGERMSKTVSDLQPGTKYRFRAFVTAGGETTYGKEVEFVTLSSSLDVNLDGEVNIADVNSVIDLIMVSGGVNTGDVNGDGEINIADINTLIDAILSK